MKLANSHPGKRGKSIREKLWDEMDCAYDNVLNAEPGSMQLHTYQGTCIGLAKALALMEHPDLPDYDAVRRRAAERARERGR